MAIDRPYAFMTIGKVKNLGTLTAKGNHNMRVMHNDNVISDLSVLNRTYVDIGDSWDVEIPEGKTKEDLTFADAFNNRIKSLPYYQDHNVRSNAVYAYEMVMSYTKDDAIDPYAWAEKSMEWVHQTFDGAGDGKSNVLHAVLHMDEPGNPHLHVIVVPIDENGKLNAAAYTDGSRVMSQLQTTYAKSVEEFGLQRGVAGSSAKHKDIRKLYATLNNVKVNHPMPKEGQTAMEFYNEFQDSMETRILASYKEFEDMKTRTLQELDRKKMEYREFLNKDLEAERAIVKHETRLHEENISKLRNEQAELQQNISNYQEQYDILARQLEAMQLVFQNTTQDQEDLEVHRAIKKGFRAMQELEPDEAEKYEGYINHIIDYGEEHDIDTIEIEPELN